MKTIDTSRSYYVKTIETAREGLLRGDVETFFARRKEGEDARHRQEYRASLVARRTGLLAYRAEMFERTEAQRAQLAAGCHN